MNIFETAAEFVELDNRRNRLNHATTTKESLWEKFKVQLPTELISGKNILDLGCCLGAAGHYALTHGANHYTGVELQTYYSDTANTLLSKYWDADRFTIINSDIEEFLLSNTKKYDYVLAAGIIYAFVDVISVLKKISSITKEHLMLDTVTVYVNNEDPNSGIILITDSPQMIKADKDNVDCYKGVSSRIDMKALDILLGLENFVRDGDIIKPIKYTDTPADPYNVERYYQYNNFYGTGRFMVRYKRDPTQNRTTLRQQIVNDNKHIGKKWVFDESVADRFQHEAETNIPSYHAVIDKCLQFANKHLNKNDSIVDVGSALGYTINKFVNAGFTNIIGIDNSPSMIAKSMHGDKIIYSDTFVKKPFKLVMMNWTLHFIQDKESYLKDIYDSLDNGYLILTDKCSQSDTVKNLYYDFKRSKGVSDDYITMKEQNLKDVMKSVTVEWYLGTLKDIGFTVDIIHGDLGFTTFLCSATQN
jgi:cyclopropane fatty-acyl-phospholipid synthase-like methyltransferase